MHVGGSAGRSLCTLASGRPSSTHAPASANAHSTFFASPRAALLCPAAPTPPEKTTNQEPTCAVSLALVVMLLMRDFLLSGFRGSNASRATCAHAHSWRQGVANASITAKLRALDIVLRVMCAACC